MQIIREFLENPSGTKDLVGIKRRMGVSEKHIREEFGLSKTESKEFLAKFEEPKHINFDIDLSKGQPPEFFEDKFRKAAEGA